MQMTMTIRILKLLLFFAWLALMLSATAKAQAWRQIVPLRTTRNDVERLLGPAKIVGSVPTYYFDDEKVEVFYAQYKCGDRLNSERWNVPLDTVLSIHVVPKQLRRIEEMHLDLSRFRKERWMWDVPNSSLLVNDVEGITLFLGDDIVGAYSYGPRASDRPLRCPDYSEEEERRRRDCFPAALAVECSSEEISVGQTIECKVISDAPNPGFEWIISPGSSQSSHNGKAITVTLNDARRSKIEVSVKIVAPNVFFDTASWELRVVKAKRKPPSGRR
jgi:hypothetical protein